MPKTIEQLMSLKLIPEILDECALCTTTDQLKAVLVKNQSPAFKTMLQYVFYPNVQFTITELPPYRPDVGPKGLSPNSLNRELGRFYVLLENKQIPLKKKREILIQMCESVHPTEAETIGKIIGRDLRIPLLTYELVREIWPGLLPV